MKLSIIIPVYNEVLTIDHIIEEIEQTHLPENISKEIIIIDDGSTDGTTEHLVRQKNKPRITVLFEKKNRGKTAAVKLGIQEASGDYVIIQDADLEYHPSHYHRLLEEVLKNSAPVVYGSRFLGTIENMTFINRAANIIANQTLNLLFGSRITDFHTCHKLIKKNIFDRIKINSQNFSFDTEITAKMLKNNIPILEVPIDYKARDKKSGKKITWGNALETYFILFKCKFSRNK